MNLLYFSYEFPPFFAGGLGTYSFEMSRRIARMGNSVSVFAKNPGDALTSDLFEGVETHRPLLVDAIDLLPAIVPGDVQYWPLGSQNYFAEVLTYNILSASKAANLLVKTNRRRFDLVVAHDWLSVMAGIICKRAIEKPFVFHIHSTEEGRTRDGSPTIKNLEKLGGQVADLTVTVSYAMRDHLMSIGYDEKKIRVVHNGVDEKKYDITHFSEGEISTFRKELGVGSDPMIFFIGRLTWVKGADTLVRAMPMILKEVPDVKLVILGSGDQEGLIRNLVSQLGIQDNVKL
ncbi:MAG: glycosyltransferase family 4 protein, partial [Candidatus Bathyarchaeota archaeon]